MPRACQAVVITTVYVHPARHGTPGGVRTRRPFVIRRSAVRLYLCVPTGTTSSQPASVAESTWRLTLAASTLAPRLDDADTDRAFGATVEGDLAPVTADDPGIVLQWRRQQGWHLQLPADDPRRDPLNLYLPVCSATPARPITIAHLGQSVDGFIATHAGDSRFVTGHANIVHLHGLRALCDAVVVGAGTVAADDPQLTTRHVPGPHPLRVVFDPTRRLTASYRVFTDETAPTLYVCDHSQLRPGESRLGHAAMAGIDSEGEDGAVGALLRLLRSQGCARVFIEGGGVTVSAFLQANLLDRLHLAIAPVLIGDGRPAIRLTARRRLRDCARPRYHVYRMGGDILYDYDLTGMPEPAQDTAAGPAVAQII
jgi:riboflavin-specific deaminase-like protein